MDLLACRIVAINPFAMTPNASWSRHWRELLGEELRAVRLERGETLEAVARRARVSLPYLSEVERGRKEASSEIIEALCGALGISLTDLAAGIADRSRGPVVRGMLRLAA